MKQLATKLNLEGAEDETYELLNDYHEKNFKILMHCFTGSSIFAEKLLYLNAYFSASGIITFNNSKDLQNTFKNIPVTKLLIETDSPFLAPVPMRGKSNQPAYVRYIAQFLSKFFNISLKQFIKITDNNFYKLFSKAKRYNDFQ